MILKDKVSIGIHYFRLIRFLGREKATSLYDSLLLSLKIQDYSILKRKDSKKKKVVFAGQVLNHRIIKIAKWLKSSGRYEITIVCHKSSVRVDLSADHYHELILFRNKIHLERIIKGAKEIDLIIAFTSKPSYAEIAVRHSTVPTILDVYDCMVIYHGKTSRLRWLQKELVSEEFCFKHASAIMARSPENRLALKMYGVRKKQAIYFADYCDNDYFVTQKKEIENTQSEIHITYAGGIHGKHLKNKLAQGLTDFYAFIESLENQCIHFHIYPSPLLNRENYYDYVEASQSMKYLHLHESISQQHLALELSEYHFGALPHFRTDESQISDDKLERATSLKFYNYLEAGIPILVSVEMGYMAWFVKRYDIGIVFEKKDFPHLREIILKSDYPRLKSNVLKTREKLSMKQNLSRLMNFLDQVQVNKPSLP